MKKKPSQPYSLLYRSHLTFYSPRENVVKVFLGHVIFLDFKVSTSSELSNNSLTTSSSTFIEPNVHTKTRHIERPRISHEAMINGFIVASLIVCWLTPIDRPREAFYRLFLTCLAWRSKMLRVSGFLTTHQLFFYFQRRPLMKWWASAFGSASGLVLVNIAWTCPHHPQLDTSDKRRKTKALILLPSLQHWQRNDYALEGPTRLDTKPATSTAATTPKIPTMAERPIRSAVVVQSLCDPAWVMCMPLRKELIQFSLHC